jgi:hypothetical protein
VDKETNGTVVLGSGIVEGTWIPILFLVVLYRGDLEMELKLEVTAGGA